jgi:hypothetical protein
MRYSLLIRDVRGSGCHSELRGTDLSELTPNDATLLATMITTVGTIWSVGLVAFGFLYERYKVVLDTPLKESPPAGLLSGVIWGLTQGIFLDVRDRVTAILRGFVFASFLAFISIFLSSVIFAINSRELLWLAWAGFLASITTFFALTLLVYQHTLTAKSPPS